RPRDESDGPALRVVQAGRRHALLRVGRHAPTDAAPACRTVHTRVREPGPVGAREGDRASGSRLDGRIPQIVAGHEMRGAAMSAALDKVLTVPDDPAFAATIAADVENWRKRHDV